MAEDRQLRPNSKERQVQQVADKVVKMAITTSSEPEVIDHQKPSLSSLPDDVIASIISFLPSSSCNLSDHSLRIAYSNLSLSCLNPRYIDLYVKSFKHVKGLTHPSYACSTSPTDVHCPTHLKKTFLCFLLRQCQNVIELRTPCVSDMLQYVGNRIEELSFVDTGLTDTDLRCLATSRLKFVSVTYPSSRVLVALAHIRTLEALELRQVLEISDLIDFISCTSANSISLSFCSPFLREPALAVFQGLTRLKSFTFECTRHYMWTLPYLRKLAMTVGDVTMAIEGFKVFVRKPNPNEMSCTAWDEKIRSLLLFGRRLRFDEPYFWPLEVHLLRLDIGHLLNALRQGVTESRLKRLLGQYFERDSVQDVPVELRLDCFTTELLLLRCAWDIIRDCSTENVRTLKISYIYLLCAGPQEDVDGYRSFFGPFNDFDWLSTIEICADSADSTPFPLRKTSRLSPRFIMGLVTFLRIITRNKQSQLRTVVLQEAGELVLQRTGVSALSDEKTVKRLIKSVIAWIKQLEQERDLELGTIIGQLQYWESRKLRTVDRKELDDVKVIRHLPLRHFDDIDFDSHSENCEFPW